MGIERLKMVLILFGAPILTHAIAFSLGQIFRLVWGIKAEDNDYLLIVSTSTFGNHGIYNGVVFFLCTHHF